MCVVSGLCPVSFGFPATVSRMLGSTICNRRRPAKSMIFLDDPMIRPTGVTIINYGQIKRWEYRVTV